MPRLQKDAALIEQTIPSLVNGVSRQSIQSRRDSQCEEQENILSTVAEGIVRRPPTEHVGILGASAPASWLDTFTFHTDDVNVANDSIDKVGNGFSHPGEFGPIYLGPYNHIPGSTDDILEDSAPYWINIINSNSFQFLNGQGGPVIDITNLGYGGPGDVNVYTMGPQPDISDITFQGAYTVTPTATGADFGTDGAHFSIINRGDDQQFLVALTKGDVTVYDVRDGTQVEVIDGTHPGNTTFGYSAQDPTVDIALNEIDFAALFPYDGVHNYQDYGFNYGPVRLTNDALDLPAGLLPDTDYWVEYVSPTRIAFLDGPTGSRIDLTDQGTGTTTIANLGGFHSGLFEYNGENNYTPAEMYETVTVADYTFVVNKSMPLAMTGAADNPREHEMECLIGVKEGATSGYYNRLRLTMGTASLLSNTTNGTSSDLMMDQFCQKLTGTTDPYGTRGNAAYGNGEFADWIWTRLNRTVIYGFRDTEIVPPVNQAYDLDTEDLYGDTIHELITTTVSGRDPSILKFSDVPAEAREGFTIEVQGDEGNTEDSFYIRYDADRKSWVETVKPNINSTFDPLTLPHALVYNQTTGKFTFEQIEWATRGAGDEVTAPEPQSIGKTVNDLFIHEGRLCLLTGENVLMSEAGDYFNFWPTTVTTLIDSDPIDVAGTGNRVAIWDYAVPARQQVLLYSSVGDLVSVVLGGNNDTISVKNARIQVLGTWSHSKLRPQTLGSTVYYTLDKGGSSAVHAMNEVEVELWNSDEVTAHIPGYVPLGLTDATTSEAEQIVLYRTASEPNNLYVYAAETIGGQAIISSWSRWSLDSSDVILAAEWVESILYLVIERSDGVHLERMDLGKLDEELGQGVNPFGHRLYLDSLTQVTGSYDVATNDTVFTLPYPVDSGEFQVVRGQEWTSDRGLGIAVKTAAGSTITVTGDYSAHPVWIGRSYTSTYQMSQIVKRNAEGFGELNGRLQLRKGRVAYSETGAFDVVISSTEDDEVATLPFTPAITGGSLLGAVELSDGTFPFHIGGKNTDVRVTFQSSSFLPFKLSSVNWEGRFYKTAQ